MELGVPRFRVPRPTGHIQRNVPAGDRLRNVAKFVRVPRA